MKLTRATEQERVYSLQPPELQMLLIVLGSFPVLNRPQPLSKSGDKEWLVEGQQLLDEAMSEHWQSLRRELDAWLKAPERFRQVGNGLEWRIENDRREWLLQVFNNIRVGSWMALGSPDDLDEARTRVAEDSVHHLALMEMAGMFQSALLEEAGG